MPGGGEVTHAVLQGKIEYEPGAFDAFLDRNEVVSRLESEEIRKQMVELGVQMEIVQISRPEEWFYKAYIGYQTLNNTLDLLSLHANLQIIKEMTKSEIVKEISARTGIDGKAVLAVVEGFMNEVKTSLGEKENVYLRGFGSFILKKRAQKIARNISKNTTMIIPAHNIPAFKPSDKFLTMLK